MTLEARRPLTIAELIWRLALRHLHGRYVGSAMGMFWTVVHPLVTLTVWTFVFSYILKIRFSEQGGITDFAFFLFCGMVPFLSFQETVQNCTVSVTSHASLIKNLVFPSKSIQFSIGVAALISQFIGLGILTVAVLILRQHVPIYLPLVLPFAFLLMLFAIGIGFITATLHVFFRDTAQVVGVMLMLWLYGTPIFYPAHVVPKHLWFLMYINPLAYVANVYRSIILLGDLPSLRGFAVFMAISMTTFWVGFRIYTRYYPRFIDEL